APAARQELSGAGSLRGHRRRARGRRAHGQRTSRHGAGRAHARLPGRGRVREQRRRAEATVLPSATELISEERMGDLLFEKKEGVVIVTFNRPAKKNAFTPEMVVRLAEAWTEFRDDGSL